MLLAFLMKLRSPFFLGGRHRLQVPCDLQKSKDATWFETALQVVYVTWQYSSTIAKSEELKLKSPGNKVPSIVRRNSSFVGIAKSVLNFSPAFDKEHGMSFLAARIVDIVDDMHLFDHLTDDSPHTYQVIIQVAKFLFQRPNIRNIIEEIDEEETGSRTLGVSRLNDKILLLSWTEDGLTLFFAASQYIKNQKEHHPFHVPSFYKSKKGLFRELCRRYQERDKTASSLFPSFFCRAPSATDTRSKCIDKVLFNTRASTSTTSRLNRTVERAQQTTAAAPGSVCKQFTNLNRSLLHHRTLQLS